MSPKGFSDTLRLSVTVAEDEMAGGRATGKTGQRRGGEGDDADGRRSRKADGGPRGEEEQEERNERGRREARRLGEGRGGLQMYMFETRTPQEGLQPTKFEVRTSNFELRRSEFESQTSNFELPPLSVVLWRPPPAKRNGMEEDGGTWEGGSFSANVLLGTAASRRRGPIRKLKTLGRRTGRPRK